MGYFLLLTCAIGGNGCYTHLQDTFPTMQMCLVNSQIALVEYAKTHPSRKVERFICTNDEAKVKELIGGRDA